MENSRKLDYLQSKRKLAISFFGSLLPEAQTPTSGPIFSYDKSTTYSSQSPILEQSKTNVLLNSYSPSLSQNSLFRDFHKTELQNSSKNLHGVI